LAEEKHSLATRIRGQHFVAFDDKGCDRCGENSGLPICYIDERWD
jgi:hypothetical protein